MNCRQFQDRLLSALDLRPESLPSAAAREHFAQCDTCRRLTTRLAELEEAWRSLPLPSDVEESKRAFLARLEEHALPPPSPAAPPRARKVSRRRLLQWCAASAAGAAAVGAGVWLVFSQRQALAGDDLLDRLVDWNLRMTQAQSETERQGIYGSQREQLRALLGRVRLPGEQNAIAVALLSNGAWLVGRHDPVTEADRFDELADRLLGLALTAAASGDQRRMRQRLAQYNRVLETGVELNIEQAERSGAFSVERQRRLERFALGDPQHIQKLAALLENAPDSSRSEIQRSLGMHHKHAKKFPHAKPRHKSEKRQARGADSKSPSEI